MKTDRFTDIIRRKLESIRPEFTDNDWARMQATLQQVNLTPNNPVGTQSPFSGGIWAGKSWLLAAATISTAVLVAVSLWQRSEINQLRQTVGQLTKQKAHQPVPSQVNSPPLASDHPVLSPKQKANQNKQTPEVVPSTNQPIAAHTQPDTVYITRYLPKPNRRSSVEVSDAERLKQNVSTEPAYSSENRVPSSTNLSLSHPQTSLSKTHQTEPYGASSTVSSVNENADNSSVTPTPSVSVTRPFIDRGTSDQSAVSHTSKGRVPKQGSTEPMSSMDNRDNRSALAPENQLDKVTPSVGTSEKTANYELVTSRPLSTKPVNWNALVAQRVKRMRLARTVATVSAVKQAPVSQPVNPVALRLRVGVGTELSPNQWNTGVFTELLVGKRWMLGVGFSRAIYEKRFMNDRDFNMRTHRNFRREFARGTEPFLGIADIDTRTVRFQVPINIGYRLPLSQTLSLLPTVGTYLNLSSTEDVSFNCQSIFPRGYDGRKLSFSRPVDLLTNIVLSAGLEWQRSHWVVQGSPVIAIPLQDEFNWQNNTTIGLRARVLYQF